MFPYVLMEKMGIGTRNALILLEHLYWHPVVSVQNVEKVVNLTYSNANSLVSRLLELGLLKEITGQKRNRRFAYDPYLIMLSS